MIAEVDISTAEQMGLMMILMVVLAVVMRVIAGLLDAARIQLYITDQGWTIVKKRWAPLGPGCFGERNARIYKISYLDKHDNLHKSYVKYFWCAITIKLMLRDQKNQVVKTNSLGVVTGIIPPSRRIEPLLRRWSFDGFETAFLEKEQIELQHPSAISKNLVDPRIPKKMFGTS